MGQIWVVVVRSTLAASVMSVVACTASPPAAASNLHLTEYEQRQRMVLCEAERAEIRDALASLVVDHQIVRLPAPAENGMRWSDVELAAYYACLDVEVAAVRSVNAGRTWKFELRTVNERPGRLLVRRVDGPSVYAAEATIGRFKDDDALAERLLAAFDKRMRDLGAKRGF